MRAQNSDQRKERKGALAIEHIRTRISDGLLKPGDRLPPEREFAKMLSMSRPSLRTAVSFLTAVGLTEVRPGVGTFVTERAEMVTGLEQMCATAADSLGQRNILEARCLIEGNIARMAAVRRQQEHLLVMADHLAQMCASLDDVQVYSHYGLCFRRTVAKASGNSILSALFEVLIVPEAKDGSGRSIRVSDLPASIKCYSEMYHAIRKRDSSGAAGAVLRSCYSAAESACDQENSRLTASFIAAHKHPQPPGSCRPGFL